MPRQCEMMQSMRMLAPRHTILSTAPCVMVQAKVDRVLLVGGATRMHKIRRMLTDYFEKEPDTDIDADEAVMHGAAIVAARLGPVSPRGLGGEVTALP